ncbi:hypothetical protein NDU88_000665, partial [Pleurodeles waltl]
CQHPVGTTGDQFLGSSLTAFCRYHWRSAHVQVSVSILRAPLEISTSAAVCQHPLGTTVVQDFGSNLSAQDIRSCLSAFRGYNWRSAHPLKSVTFLRVPVEISTSAAVCQHPVGTTRDQHIRSCLSASIGYHWSSAHLQLPVSIHWVSLELSTFAAVCQHPS